MRKTIRAVSLLNKKGSKMVSFEEMEATIREVAINFKRENNKLFIYECMRLAEEGDVKSQVCFGVMYQAGIESPVNSVFAHKWFSIAALNGSSDGARFRDDIDKRMTLEQLSEAKNLANIWVASRP